MWVTTHELLQFCRDKSWDPNGAHENNEDNFLILLIFYQKYTVPENSLLPYENNKKWVNND